MQTGEPRIKTALTDQLVVRSGFDNPAIVHDNDPVCRTNGGEAVGDHHRRALMHQPVERILHQPLAFGIERRCRLVEQQQRRIAEQRTGNRNPLALAARQAGAGITQICVEALWQGFEKLAGVGGVRCGPDFGVARGPVAIAQIIAGRGGEQGCVLRHHRNPGAHIGGVSIANVGAIEQNAT